MSLNSRRLREWEKPQMLSILRSWARNGCTMENIAERMGISRSTLYNFIKESPKIAEAIRVGGAIAVAHAEDMLMQKISQGDTTAIIFYLKSRRRALYNPSQPVNRFNCFGFENASLQNEILDILNDSKEGEN